ncbi:MAG TPA: hypothetical protein VGH56_01280 [Solirubrobacteraceae bacterium]
MVDLPSGAPGLVARPSVVMIDQAGRARFHVAGLFSRACRSFLSAAIHKPATDECTSELAKPPAGSRPTS